MKKILLAIFCSVSSLVFAQPYIISVSPGQGCPNTSHNITVSITNNSGVDIPSGISYTIELVIKDNSGTSLKTFTNTYSDGLPFESSQICTLEDVSFAGEMTCEISGTISAPALSLTQTLAPVDYMVQYPPDLTIVQNNATLSVTTTLGDHSVQYFKNSSYQTTTTDGNYSPTSDGLYSAKAVQSIYSATSGNITCVSENFSNTIQYSVFQISIAPAPGCAETTHDVVISVTNNGPNAPSAMYDVSLSVKKSDNTTVLKTLTKNFTDGFANGTTKQITIEDVPFEGAMTCKITGTVSGIGTISGPMGPMPFPYSLNLPTQNYVVGYPQDISITETAGQLSVTTALPLEYDVFYYLDGNFYAESPDGNYTPEEDGSYTAKAVRYVYSTQAGDDVACVSANASNAINITINSIKESENISISVYPNPVVSSVTISAGTTAELTYELADVTGNVVRSSSFNGVGVVNAENLQAGSYVLTVKNQNARIASYKLIK